MGDKGDEERAEGSTTRQKGGQDKQEHQKQEQQQQQEEAPEDHGADIMRACESLHRATVRLVQLNGASSRPGVLKCFGLPRLQLLAGDVWNQKGATGGGGGGCEESMWRELHQLERELYSTKAMIRGEALPAFRRTRAGEAAHVGDDTATGGQRVRGKDEEVSVQKKLNEESDVENEGLEDVDQGAHGERFRKGECGGCDVVESGHESAELDEEFAQAWRKHTMLCNRWGGLVGAVAEAVDPEICSNAFVKMSQILVAFDLLGPSAEAGGGEFSSLHLCEAPGGFVSALNHKLWSQRPDVVWRWRANSLVGGGEEVLSGDPIARRVAREEGSWFLGGPERLVLGADGTGNIRSSSNVARVRDECVAQIGRPWLVTADGSVDCSGAPGEQEDIVAPLLFCEAATALGVLAEGGCLVLKIFTFASPDMLSVLRLLSALFDEVLIAKPDSSRPGNSEAYAVCLGFRGLGALGGDADEVWSNLLRGVRDRGGVGGLHDLKRGLESWTLGEWGQGVLKAARGLWGAQCKAILCNIRLFTASCGGTAYSCLKSHRRKRSKLAQEECAKLQLVSIPRGKRLFSSAGSVWDHTGVGCGVTFHVELSDPGQHEQLEQLDQTVATMLTALARSQKESRKHAVRPPKMTSRSP